MPNRLIPLALALSLAAPFAGQAAEPSMPRRVGACVDTRIAKLEHRLQSGEKGPFIPGSGSAVAFANGGYQVGYDELPEVQGSRVGDPVRICLDRIPADCPRGDTRGRVYTTTNLRTMQRWTLPDSEHSCGGA